MRQESSQPALAKQVAPDGARLMPAPPRWLLAVPDAIRQLEARLSGLPEGVTVEAGRVEVRFASAKEAVGKLFALAQALTNDYERFETLVGKGERSG